MWINTGRIFCFLIFACAYVVAFLVVRPIHAGQVGYDAAGSVLYFDRIVTGHRLEAFLGATPKPLLTLMYGVLHSVSGDWRPISWLAIGGYAGAIAFSAALVWRLAGVAAAAFAATALLSFSGLLDDVQSAYAVEWALLFWGVAGLAVTASPPRYALAGTALCVAGLARYETVIVDLAAAVLLFVLAFRARSHPKGVSRGAWLILIGFASVPIQMFHDWLLTGIPLYSLLVPDLGSQGVPPVGPLGVLSSFGRHFATMLPLVVLGAIGVARLARLRQWPLFVGLLAMGPGSLLFFLVLSIHGTYISGRYTYPADLSLILAAAAGFSALRLRPIVGWPRLREQAKSRLILSSVAGVVAGVVLSPTFALLDPTLTARIAQNLDFRANPARARAAIDRQIDLVPGARDWPAVAHPTTVGGPRPPILLVPILLIPQIAVDHDLPLTQIWGDSGAALTTDGSYPSPGQVIYHDPRGDAPASAFTFLEAGEPVVTGRILIEPLIVDRVRRFWLVLVRAAPDG